MLLARASHSEDDAVPPVALFSLTSPTLRASKREALPIETPAESGLGKPAEFSAESSKSGAGTSLELFSQRYESMNGTPLLIAPPAKQELGGVAGFIQTKVLEPVTTLEVVKFHQVYLTGGVVGAVKNRNPFYLLNPLVFAVDW